MAEAELLAPLGELLMPSIPVGEMFRSFKAPSGWGKSYVEPDLTAYGVLKDQKAALFVEYDGYWRHATKEGMEKDFLKNSALLEFAPAGSFVIRIGHTGRGQLDGHVLCLSVNTWRPGDQTSLAQVLKNVLEQIVPRLQTVLHPSVCRCLERHLQKERSIVISQSSQEFREATAVVLGKGSTAEEIWTFLHTEGFQPEDIHKMEKHACMGRVSIPKTLQPLLQFLFDLGLTKTQVAKSVATHPPILGCSIDQNLQPTVQWLLDLGLSRSQVAKSVATHPPILGYSIDQNLQPTVQWFSDLGLTKSQVAKAVATFPPILGCSIDQNLQPTVQWFSDLGLTKSQVAKAVATFPPILGCSIDQNLQLTVQWFSDLGLTKSQVAKAVATHPQILGCSIDQNLQPTVQWLLDLGLSRSQVAKSVATHPPILGYSIDQNLQPTVQWFSDLGLTKSQVAKAVATFPPILGCSIDQNLQPTWG